MGYSFNCTASCKCMHYIVFSRGVRIRWNAVERMFSISGHIFSLKRRRLGYVFFSDLVFLKLNEELLPKLKK